MVRWMAASFAVFAFADAANVALQRGAFDGPHCST